MGGSPLTSQGQEQQEEDCSDQSAIAAAKHMDINCNLEENFQLSKH